ncbi:hypothetical protein FNV43_RR04107 [Rhamnella rubrinervis]|uniref:C3H1-type domain-containing protein n=1 Tax=Rhamnella rubrinervis TaxID=2594499 RepID=A0A8K0MP98_9ROSA|nr:hypothetical protein FNV43_RR04107 [Rhamnella rubrinervis]
MPPLPLQAYCVDNEEQYGPALKRAKTCGEIQSICLFYPNMSSDSIGFSPLFDQHSQFEQQIRPLKKPRISEEGQSISLPCPPLKAVMNNNSIGFWTQLSTKKNVDPHSQFEQHAKPRIPEENQSHSLPYPPPMNARMTTSNARVNNGANNVFFKTRLCAKFIVGKCKNGENCNFAHGIEDMRPTFIFQPGYKDGGTKLNLHMVCLGLNWDPGGLTYEFIRSGDGCELRYLLFLSLLRYMVQGEMADAYVLIKKEIKDCSESRCSLIEGLPVVSISVGDSAEFLCGDERNVYKTEKVILVLCVSTHFNYNNVSNPKKGRDKAIWLSDFQIMVNAINSTTDHGNWETWHEVQSVRNKLAGCCSNFYWINRNYNRAADIVAKYSLKHAVSYSVFDKFLCF